MHISYHKYRIRDFAEDYERVNPRPVIIKGWMHPKLKMELSLYNLQKKYGDLKIEVENAKEAARKTLSLQDYITSIINNEDEEYYLSNWQYHTQLPHLDTLYRRPKFFRDNWFDQLPKKVKPVLKWLFLGPPNSYTAVHNDVFSTSFWNILVYGKKLWMFFSPNQSETIETGLDLFDPAHHTFLIKTKPLIICQNAGDLLYGPSNWMHQVVNLQTSLAMTENYVNQNNYQDVLKRLAQAKHDSESTYYTILKFLAERNLTNGEKK